MAVRRPLIVGNWKMNGRRADGPALASRIVADVVGKGVGSVGAELVLCPPATLLHPVGAVLAGTAIALGGQDCHPADSGAHTGDIAAPMLADLGCRYVIVGHSERRQNHGETSDLIKAKAEAALRAGLVAIVCLGETEAERDAGKAAAVVAAQLSGSLPDGATAGTVVVAYEPVWAIGTGRTPTVADIAAMHGAIRGDLAARLGDAAAVRVLYGGSVKPDNAAAILAVADVDGALVGGASLSAPDFLAIARACPVR